MATLAELGDYLEAQGVGSQNTATVSPTARIMLGSRPDYPDKVLVLAEYPGGPPEYSQDVDLPVAERPAVQVVARDITYDGASALAHAAWRALSRINNQTLTGTYYRSVRPNNSPGIMGTDTNDRPMVFFNLSIEKEPSLA